MSQLLQEIVLALLGVNGLSTLVIFLITRHDQKKDTPEKRALKNILARDLLIDMREWLHADERYIEDWEIIDNNFQSYTELGGNGKIHKLYNECKEIPTTE